MTIEQFQNFSQTEKEQLVELIRTFTYKNSVISIDKFDVRFYFDKRLAERDSTKPWPKELSKKETVICKLNFLNDIIENAKKENVEKDSEQIQFMQKFQQLINSTQYKAFSFVSGIGTKPYPGIPKDVSIIFNELYLSIRKGYTIEESIK